LPLTASRTVIAVDGFPPDTRGTSVRRLCRLVAGEQLAVEVTGIPIDQNAA